MSQPEPSLPASPLIPTEAAAPMAPVVESELPGNLAKGSTPINPAEPATTTAAAPRALPASLFRQHFYRGARYGVLALLVVAIGMQFVRQQAQQQQLAELESALVARLPAGLTATVEALRQQVTGLEMRLQVIPAEFVSRADWQAGIDTQQHDTRAALDLLRGQLQQQTDVQEMHAHSLRSLQGTLSELDIRLKASTITASPSAMTNVPAKSSIPPNAAASPKTTSPSASARQSVPFVLTGIETRGGQTFAVVAPLTGQGLAQLQLVAPGNAVQGWRLVGIEGRQARFLPPNSTQPRVLTPQ